MARKKDDVKPGHERKIEDAAAIILEREQITPPGYLDDVTFVTPGLRAGDSPRYAALPDLAEMKNMTNEELMRTMTHYGITEPLGILQSQAMEYVRRMMPLRTDEDINLAFAELVANERRQLLGTARRVQQQWSTLDAIQGNLEQELIWLAEDDEATCDSCAPRSGEIDTFIGWKQRGMPGSATCRGGNYCRCDLVAID